jgi:class 3 adenylate cyclase
MQEEMRRFAERLRAEKGINLEVRVGANSGEVVVRNIETGVSHSEYIPIGHSTSLAARLQTLAARVQPRLVKDYANWSTVISPSNR